MGMKFHTDIMGDVTTNIGVISYDKRKVAGSYGINLKRYPEGLNLKTQSIDLEVKLMN